MSATGARSAGTSTSTGAGAGHAGRDRGGRTPAQWYCLLAGAALLLAGIAGFIVNQNFRVGSAVDGDQLILFEVNGWHNVVHIASGLLLLAVFAKRKPAKTVAILFGLVYGAVAIWGIVHKINVANLIPVNPADNILHVALSAVGLLAGFVSSGDDREVERTAG